MFNDHIQKLDTEFQILVCQGRESPARDDNVDGQYRVLPANQLDPVHAPKHRHPDGRSQWHPIHDQDDQMLIFASAILDK